MNAVDTIRIVCDNPAHRRGAVRKVATFTRARHGNGRPLAPGSPWRQVVHATVAERADHRRRQAEPLPAGAREIDRLIHQATGPGKPEAVKRIVAGQVDDRVGAPQARPDAETHVTVVLACPWCGLDLQRRGEVVAEALDAMAAAGVSDVTLSALARTLA